MLNLSRLFLLFALVSLMYSQIQYGGIPRTFEIESLEDLSPLYMPSVDFDEQVMEMMNFRQQLLLVAVLLQIISLICLLFFFKQFLASRHD